MDKILVLGAFNIEYIHDNSRAPFKEVLGERCITLNVLPLLFYVGAPILEEFILSFVKENNIKLVHFYHDWIKGSFSEVFWTELLNVCSNVSAFYPDDEPGKWMDSNVEHYDRHYSHIFTHSLEAQKLRHSNGVENIYHLPWGYNKNIFYPTVAIDLYHHDLVFIGKNKISDSSGTGVEDGARRDLLLDLCAKFAEKNRLSFAIYGYGWESHPVLSSYWKGVLPINDFTKVFGAAKVVINPAWAPGSEKPQVKLRHFEVLGSGALQLTNYNKELIETVGENELIKYFKDERDFECQLELIFNSNIQISNYNVINNHTIQSRIENIVNTLGFGLIKNESRVLHIDIDNELNMDSLFEFLIDRFNENKNIDFIHLNTISKYAKFYCDDAWIELFADLDRITQFGILFDFSQFQDNHLHFSDNAGDLSCDFYDSEKSLNRINGVFNLSPFNQRSYLNINGVNHLIDSLCFPRDLIFKESLNIPVKIINNTFPYEYLFYKDSVKLKRAVCIWRDQFDLIDALQNEFQDKFFSLCLYGVGGHLGQSIFRYVSLHTKQYELYLLDNSKAGNKILNHTIYSKDLLLSRGFDFIFIVAEVSGPSIYDALMAEGYTNLVRCYNYDLMKGDIQKIVYSECDL